MAIAIVTAAEPSDYIGYEIPILVVVVVVVPSAFSSQRQSSFHALKRGDGARDFLWSRDWRAAAARLYVSCVLLILVELINLSLKSVSRCALGKTVF
jgi:hypothetical protein